MDISKLTLDELKLELYKQFLTKEGSSIRASFVFESRLAQSDMDSVEAIRNFFPSYVSELESK